MLKLINYATYFSSVLFYTKPTLALPTGGNHWPYTISNLNLIQAGNYSMSLKHGHGTCLIETGENRCVGK